MANRLSPATRGEQELVPSSHPSAHRLLFLFKARLRVEHIASAEKRGGRMARIHDRGRRGEAIAARHLEAAGWEVLDRNWRAGHAELDLVVRRGDLVAFVEVKTRARGGRADPLEGITAAKRGEVERAARRWILERGPRIGSTHGGGHSAAERGVEGAAAGGKNNVSDCDGGTTRGTLRFRFDAVAIILRPDGGAEVHHVEDAWWIGDK